jgi:galactoside O-acetyltransferase
MHIFNKLRYYLFVKIKVIKYKILSDAKPLNKPKLIYPVLFSGKGKIILDKNVQFGYSQSPYYYSSYGYMEARNESAEIIIGKNVVINNNFSIVALQKIEIQEETVIGTNFSVMDSDFHNLEPEKRHDKNPISEKVLIGKNVFIGNNVTVLKGVTIGDNSVIGTGSIVTKDVEENTIVAGNPIKVIRKFE